MKSIQLPSRQLVSQNDQSMIARPDVPRSKFKGMWTRLTTFDAGYLVPFLVEEILPGDHVSYNVQTYIRLSTPLFPLFSNQRVDTHFFFVPNRLTWDNWVRMMGEQDDPDATIDYNIPTLASPSAGYAVGSIYDHMGLPTVAAQITEGYEHNVLPLRAYNLIYNEWFRDQNLIDSAIERHGDDGDLTTDYALRRRAKSHDPFTSCLPWPQKFTAPTIPILGSAPVRGIGAGNNAAGTGLGVGVIETGGLTPTYANAKDFDVTSNDDRMFVKTIDMGGGAYAPDIYADLTEATGISINALRQAWLVQSILERDARGGTRYIEIMKSHFGVTSPDARLQRPEYIGGGQTPLNITAIAQTAPEAETTVGALGATGTGVGSHRASYAATEHGYVLGLISIKSELAYQQGLHPMWSRSTRFDFYLPMLAGLGERAVLMKEIYLTGNETDDNEVFGYQERWHELRTRYSEVTGLFRSTATGNIDEWHLAQFFATPPFLGQAFIEDNPPMARVLAAGELAVGQQYLADICINRTIVRALPVYGTPASIGRF